jgi:hypothetical protein
MAVVRGRPEANRVAAARQPEVPARGRALGPERDAARAVSKTVATRGGPQQTASLRESPARAATKRVSSAKETDLRRIAELKSKLRDEDYMNGAILRIATVLSARLTLR